LNVNIDCVDVNLILTVQARNNHDKEKFWPS
jgi:hypothetical protein